MGNGITQYLSQIKRSAKLMNSIWTELCIMYYMQKDRDDSKIQRFKHCLFRGNTDIHIYITIMDTWQSMFLNGNMI